MSNPYAPKTRVAAVKAKATTEAPQNTEVTVEDVPNGSITDILDWVGEDKERAKLAIEAEKQGKKRPSLLKTLKGI